MMTARKPHRKQVRGSMPRRGRLSLSAAAAVVIAALWCQTPTPGAQALESSLEDRQRLLGRGDVVALAEPLLKNDDTVEFDVGQATTFLDFPRTVTSAASVTLVAEGPGKARAQAPVAAGFQVPFAVCELTDVGGTRHLVCTIPKGAAKRHAAYLAWLVIEVADPVARRIVQCPLYRPAPDTKELVLLPDDAGHSYQADAVTIGHPWPATLMLELTGAAGVSRQPVLTSPTSPNTVEVAAGGGDGLPQGQLRLSFRAVESGLAVSAQLISSTSEAMPGPNPALPWPRTPTTAPSPTGAPDGAPALTPKLIDAFGLPVAVLQIRVDATSRFPVSGTARPSSPATGASGSGRLTKGDFAVSLARREAGGPNVWVFRVGNARMFSNPPPAVQGLLACAQPAPDELNLSPARWRGASPLAACRIQSGAAGSYVSCKVGASSVANPDQGRLVNWFVVEAIDPVAKRMYQCALGSRSVTAVTVSGTVNPAFPRGTIEFEYPWAKLLQVVPAVGEPTPADRTQSLASPCEFQWTTNVGTRSLIVQCRLVARAEDLQTVALEWQVPTWSQANLLARRSRAQYTALCKQLADLVERRTSPNVGLRTGVNANIAKTRAQINKIVKPLADLIEAIESTVRANGRFTITDPWDVPVAELALEMSGPTATTLLEGARFSSGTKSGTRTP